MTRYIWIMGEHTPPHDIPATYESGLTCKFMLAGPPKGVTGIPKRSLIFLLYLRCLSSSFRLRMAYPVWDLPCNRREQIECEGES